MRFPTDVIIHYGPDVKGTSIEATVVGELIRCKDCKHNKNNEWVDCPITAFFGRTLDNYCSLAERRDNETD